MAGEAAPSRSEQRQESISPERRGSLIVTDMLVLQQHQTIGADGDKAGISEQQLSQRRSPRTTLGSSFLAPQPRGAVTRRHGGTSRGGSQAFWSSSNVLAIGYTSLTVLRMCTPPAPIPVLCDTRGWDPQSTSNGTAPASSSFGKENREPSPFHTDLRE